MAGFFDGSAKDDDEYFEDVARSLSVLSQPETPRWVKLTVVGMLLHFLGPFDFSQDLLASDSDEAKAAHATLRQMAAEGLLRRG